MAISRPPAGGAVSQGDTAQRLVPLPPSILPECFRGCCVKMCVVLREMSKGGASWGHLLSMTYGTHQEHCISREHTRITACHDVPDQLHLQSCSREEHPLPPGLCGGARLCRRLRRQRQVEAQQHSRGKQGDLHLSKRAPWAPSPSKARSSEHMLHEHCPALCARVLSTLSAA
jgi:hypothetical protein